MATKKDPIKKGKLENGFEYEVDVNVLDDMEMLDALAEAQEEEPLKINVVSKKLLGKEQRKRLYDHLRNEDGRVPVEAAVQAITDIMLDLGEDGKNS